MVNVRFWVKSLVAGFVFGLAAYIISGSDASMALGLLVIYMEYKLKKEKE